MTIIIFIIFPNLVYDYSLLMIYDSGTPWSVLASEYILESSLSTK